MQGSPRGFWGKLEQAKDGTVRGWHPLADHCADVAACCEALLRETILARRLAALAGRDYLSPVQIARLCVLAVLHDIGKFNLGFQNKAVATAKLKAGHLSEVVALFGSGAAAESQLLDALRAEVLDTWGEASDQLLVATISHHGRPIGMSRSVNLACWQRDAARDPFAGIADLVERTTRWFPEAWTAADDPLPSAPAFQHAWCGHVTLADWLGSDSERFFPFSRDPAADRMPFARQQATLACARLGLSIGTARRALGPDIPGFEKVAPGYSPRPAQAALLNLMPAAGMGSVALLEAETGSGKTEAALAYYARLFHAGLVDGLYFALPTRTAATQIYRRVQAAVASLFPQGDRPAVVLAVPGYLEVDGTAGVRLTHFRVLWPDEPLRDRGWAAEHPKRYLAGAVAVGTVDQALLSALVVSHSHLRSTSLLRHLLVVDEVHASDAYMTRILEEVLDFHLAAGAHALLLSATLGAAARERLLAPAGARAGRAAPAPDAAVACPYPLVSFRQGDIRSVMPVASDPAQTKQVAVELAAEMEDPAAIARRALRAARQGARVLVLRNTVAGCVETQLALEELAATAGTEALLSRCDGIVAPHHARFARTDRERLDRAIEAAFGKESPAGGRVAVATQTVEQSLDLDADLLITDLCPLDVLLQRIGRLHRHRGRLRLEGFASARAVVLTPTEPLAARIASNGEARGKHGLGPVYDDLRALEATWRTLAAEAEIAIPADNRRLVEAATHPDLLAALAAELGEPWGQHQNKILGETFGDRRQAKLNLVRRDLTFGADPGGETVEFPSGDTARRIPTRLGLSDRLVRFDPPVPGAFGGQEPIADLTLPHHLVAPGTPADAAAAEAIEHNPEGLRFRFGAWGYRYDRLGLRTEEPR